MHSPETVAHEIYLGKKQKKNAEPPRSGPRLHDCLDIVHKPRFERGNNAFDQPPRLFQQDVRLPHVVAGQRDDDKQDGENRKDGVKGKRGREIKTVMFPVQDGDVL